jgi:hypothetical protein
MPEGQAHKLAISPRLASWMARGHPDQIRLTAFLDHVEELVNSEIDELGDQLALRLDVGITPGVDHLDQCDLDNYLYPLIKRLGAGRFDSAWATKAPGGQSCLRIERSSPCAAPEPCLLVKTTRSTETSAWKEEVRDQLGAASELPPGPVELQLGFAVGPSRNWANLWKPGIDSLTPLLGSSDPTRDWNPNDGRITILGLHRSIEPTLGNAIEIQVSGREAR